ncbi:MAG: hypothetical protein LH645_05310 [Actinomycetia bacterium]|nr:hypothetical protein [Actinomycetes bacterium]
MQLPTFLQPETRILDFGVESPDLAHELASDGVTRYLGLVTLAALHTVRSQADGLERRFHELASPDQVRRCSTDVLIVRPAFAERLWMVGELRHVRYVALESGWSARDVETRLAKTAARFSRAVTPRGRFDVGETRFDLLEISRQAPPRTRRYFSPVWGPEGLIQRLDAAGIQYAALRWFEDLPHMEPGEDLDVLVTDEHLAAFGTLMNEEPGTIPLDLYSETGLPSSDYKNMAYYPPQLARQLLDRAVVHSSGCRVPAPLDHLRSLAYHAAYHKGMSSGLASAHVAETVTDPEHDYKSALESLARSVGVRLDASLDGVDEYLAGEGWRPSVDTLVRLADGNLWIKAKFFAAKPEPVIPPETTVFLLRERLASVVGTDEVLALLDHLGFEVLMTSELDSAAAARCAEQTRGGNWGQGPFPVSGGGPVTVVVAVHYAPAPPVGKALDKYPRLSNNDVLVAKERVRDLVAARVSAHERFNPVHSSDNELEAWEYVTIALPQAAEELQELVGQRRVHYRTTVPVVRQLSRGRRAKVEVVDGADGRVVRKTFAAGYLRHMERELLALQQLSPEVAAVPPLLASGDNWFSCPYYRDQLAPLMTSRKLVPLPLVRDMVDVLRQIHEHGFDLVDAKPQNFILDHRAGLKIVDFEFLHRYTNDRPPFASSYAFRGVPAGYTDDLPVSDLSYERRWLAFTGLSADQLTSGSPMSQHTSRAVFRTKRAILGPRGPVRRIQGQVRLGARTTRRATGRTFSRWARARAKAA